MQQVACCKSSLFVVRLNVKVCYTSDNFNLVGAKSFAAVRGRDDCPRGIYNTPAEVLFFELH